MEVIAAILMAVLIAAAALLIYRSVWVPVQHLVSGAERIAGGDLEARVEVDAPRPLGRLAAALNRITADLKRASREHTEREGTEPMQELSPAQRQTIHSEKMASLGRLAAAVAHEINNPLSGMLMYARLVERELPNSGFDPEKREELGRYLGQIQSDARRCGDIVRNLLLFARTSGGEFAVHHLNHIVERSLNLVRHHLEMAKIQLETHLSDGDDAIACDEHDLQHALVALLVHAAEAAPAKGRVTIRTTAADASVRIEIVAIGDGVCQDPPPRPGWAAKADGVGPGLAGIYLIIQRHRGSLEIESAAGARTIRVLLPRNVSSTGG